MPGAVRPSCSCLGLRRSDPHDSTYAYPDARTDSKPHSHTNAGSNVYFSPNPDADLHPHRDPGSHANAYIRSYSRAHARDPIWTEYRAGGAGRD